jgi:hypothetical protein
MRIVISVVAVFAALTLALSENAVAAYPADPLADGNPAFCAPKEPIQDFGLSNLPPVQEVPESGDELGHGAVDIYGGWDHVMPKPHGFGYGFSEHHYGGTARLDWYVTASLWTIDKRGTPFQEVDREELFIGRLNAVHQPHIEVEPPAGRRGFYRLDMRISNQAGTVLGSYGTYFKVVRPFWKVKLGLARDEVQPGQRIFSRLENYGTETVHYGEAFGIQRLEGGEWMGQPDLVRGIWLRWLGILGPGRTGLCNSVSLPDDMEPGRYRIVKSVEPGPRQKRIFLTAPFTIQG